MAHDAAVIQQIRANRSWLTYVRTRLSDGSGLKTVTDSNDLMNTTGLYWTYRELKRTAWITDIIIIIITPRVLRS